MMKQHNQAIIDQIMFHIQDGSYNNPKDFIEKYVICWNIDALLRNELNLQ